MASTETVDCGVRAATLLMTPTSAGRMRTRGRSWGPAVRRGRCTAASKDVHGLLAGHRGTPPRSRAGPRPRRLDPEFLRRAGRAGPAPRLRADSRPLRVGAPPSSRRWLTSTRPRWWTSAPASHVPGHVVQVLASVTDDAWWGGGRPGLRDADGRRGPAHVPAAGGRARDRRPGRDRHPAGGAGLRRRRPRGRCPCPGGCPPSGRSGT
ncbi:hypothetical protein HBB16_18930 [Pseudonocardia sp. MCCB 268]|nr:hypothetical protein [Pseudonocardia cytotoxica]